MEEKPQAKDYPEDDKGQAAIMDDPFLLLLLDFWPLRRLISSIPR
jgi:hypothetical protein